LKIAAKADESFKFPIPLNEFWGMDPGRFPPEALAREKLFGAVSVTVPQPDGWLYENFSPVGPFPLPASESSMQGQFATVPILAGMLLPALASARGEARMAASVSSLHQLSVAFDAYQADHGNMPASLADLLPEYVGDPRMLVSPADSAPLKIKNGMSCSYRYIGNVPLHDAPPGLFIAYDHAALGGERNVLDCVGHAQRYPEAEFRKLLAEQYEKFKPIMAKPDFSGDRDRVKAFFEDKDFEEK
jgi:hypothetical protein